MTVTKRAFGQTTEGHSVEQYVLETSSGLSVSVMTYGAIITSCRVPDRTGKVQEITLGYDTLEPYLAGHPFFGATVGRFANRIAGATFQLDRKTYTLSANENGNTLHGGKRGFDKHLWSAQLTGDGESAQVVFGRTSPDGEEGFPGTLQVTVTLGLNEAGELSLLYEAESTKPTPVNLTNHTYWNLAGDAAPTILDHEIALFADHFLPVDAASIPTGEIAPVRGTAFDFLSPHRIGERKDEAGGGYDHCYVLSGPEAAARGPVPGPELAMRLAARLTHHESGRKMEVLSSMPAIQFYTGNKLKGKKARNGSALPIHAALCLETQYYPNAVNEPEFPSSILRPGERYTHRTVYRFTAE